MLALYFRSGGLAKHAGRAFSFLIFFLLCILPFIHGCLSLSLFSAYIRALIDIRPIH